MRVGLLEGILPRCSRVSSEEEVGTTGVTCYRLGLCRCEPCRELGKQEVLLRYTNVCQQRTDKLLQQDTEQS